MIIIIIIIISIIIIIIIIIISSSSSIFEGRRGGAKGDVHGVPADKKTSTSCHATAWGRVRKRGAPSPPASVRVCRGLGQVTGRVPSWAVIGGNHLSNTTCLMHVLFKSGE